MSQPNVYKIEHDGAVKNLLIYRFNCEMESRQVVACMEKDGCRPATTAELEILCREYPCLHQDSKNGNGADPIVALGGDMGWHEFRTLDEIWEGIPAVFQNGKVTKPRLNRWQKNCRFAAVTEK